MKIALGQKAKDKITGFKGIITGRASYIYGCDQYLIIPKLGKNGVRLAEWFDEGRIEIIGKGILPKEVRVEKNGGPNIEAPKHKN